MINCKNIFVAPAIRPGQEKLMRFHKILAIPEMYYQIQIIIKVLKISKQAIFIDYNEFYVLLLFHCFVWYYISRITRLTEYYLEVYLFLIKMILVIKCKFLNLGSSIKYISLDLLIFMNSATSCQKSTHDTKASLILYSKLTKIYRDRFCNKSE